MQVSKHEPYLISQAFPSLQDAPERDERLLRNHLLLPRKNAGPCPLVVRITGGEDVSGEAAKLVEEGYGVFVYYAEQQVGERDLKACAAFQGELELRLDEVLREHPILDPQRVFVDGWLSAYLIFHTQRFKASIQRPALINPTTAYGNCAAGWVERFENSLEEMLLTLAKQSVLVDVDACKTPCMVLWTEGDTRYSREQSEELYAAMKDRNPEVACRMVIFTERQWREHGLREILNWWRRFSEEAAEGA